MLTHGAPIPFFDVPTQVLRPPPALNDVPGFDVLFDRAPLPMWICDIENFRFIAVNFSALKSYGWTREEFLAMTMDRILPPKDMEGFLEYRRQVESHGAGLNQTQNWRHKTKTGEVIAVQTSSQSVTFHGRRALLAELLVVLGRPGWIGVALDCEI